MCGRMVVVPKEVVEEIIRDIINKRVVNAMPDWPAKRQSVFPGSAVTLIVPKDENLEPVTMTWGYSVSWNKSLIFNTRFDSATKPGWNMWSDSLEKRRCIVPTFGFYEPHKSETFINPRSGKENKQQYYFTQPNAPVLYLAAIYQEDRFSLMTTQPNKAVQPIHNRMPVVLESGELDTWLHGDYLSMADRSCVELQATKEQAT